MTTGRHAAPPVTLTNVSVGYRNQPVLSGIDWTIEGGSMTALIGPNGGGKSTLLKTIAGELDSLAGRITGNDRNKIAYLPQSITFDRDFPISVRDVVAMGLWRRLGPFGRIGRREGADVESALAAVGMIGWDTRSIGTLSGGQLQRILFARLMLLDAPIILLDEPFAGVDNDTVTALMNLIGQWHRNGRTILAALHDLDHVRASFPLAIRLEGAKAVSGTTEEVLGGDGP